MLVTEFSRKYGVPKSLTYEMSFMTDTRCKDSCITDIPEEELIRAVSDGLEKRIDYHKQMQERFKTMLEGMKSNGQ